MLSSQRLWPASRSRRVPFMLTPPNSGLEVAPSESVSSAHRPEGFAEILRQSLRLLPRGEVRALWVTLVIDEVRIGFARPAFRRLINLVLERTDARRQRYPLRRKEGQLALPVQPRRRHRGVGQPVEGDVVQDIVACQALALPIEHSG